MAPTERSSRQSGRRAVRIPDVKPITIGNYTLSATDMTVRGRPSYENHVGVGDFIQRTHHASGFWLADWLRYGESRDDWRDRLDQAVSETGLSEKTLKNVRAVAKIDHDIRRPDLEFGTHEVVASMPRQEQKHWLDHAATNGLTIRELRQEISASKRRKVLEGQAVLSGVYRVVLADPPWIYGDKPPSGSGAQTHYNGMTIAQMCALPVKAHTYPDAVLFMWVTAPLLLQNPGPREVIEAWGFEPKTGMVWDKVLSAGGHYVASKHEHLIIATRGSCTPDHPVPSPDSVQVIRRPGEHSEKPEEFRKIIEQLYDPPYLELFGRKLVEKWDVFGNDSALWHQEKVG